MTYSFTEQPPHDVDEKLSEWLSRFTLAVAIDSANNLSKTYTNDLITKTTNFTAQSWTSYLIDTSAGAFTVTMPANPKAGDQISFCDLMGTFGTNNLTILGNGNNVMRTNGGVLNTDNWNAPFLFTSQGWLPASN